MKWEGIALTAFIVVSIVAFVIINHYQEIDCIAKGGEWHNIGRGTVCLKPGSVIK